MFDQFPKARRELPEEYKRIYQAHYKENREGATLASSLSQKLESWLHRQVARDLREGVAGKSTLEVGAGTLNQLSYEPATNEYDIVEPFEYLYKGSESLKHVRNVYSDITDIGGERFYDRITSVATFEHICNLPEVVAKCGLLLKPKGSLRISIPSEGTLVWRLGWKLTTGLEFRLKHGLDYGLLMANEHVNTAREVEEVLRHFFAGIQVKVFGFSKSLSFYQFYGCDAPYLNRCSEYLERLPTNTS